MVSRQPGPWLNSCCSYFCILVLTVGLAINIIIVLCRDKLDIFRAYTKHPLQSQTQAAGIGRRDSYECGEGKSTVLSTCTCNSSHTVGKK
jgi:hypothetical protein